MRSTRFLQTVLMPILFFGFGANTMPVALGAPLDPAVEIEKQQKQLDEQARTIEALRKEVAAIRKEKEPESETALSVGRQNNVLVQSGNDAVQVRLYGQVNRGVLYTHDGNESNVFHVDNDNSSTRIGLLGTTPMFGQFRAGTKLEFEFQANDSNRVSQNNKNGVGDNHFRKRHMDLFIEATQFGKLSVGYGDTASNGTAEVDLSGTDVIGYSSVADMAGGIFFYNSLAPSGLSNATVGDVFTNMDGLSRDDRIRYDSPTFYGARLAVSNVSGGANDVAIRYNARLGEISLASAAAFADLGGSSDSVNYLVDGSVSVLHDSGISGTLATGKAVYSAPGKKEGKYLYLKGGFQKHFWEIGLTALALDLGFFYDIDRNGDTAKTVGLLGVQQIDLWAAEVYIGCRHYDLDRRNTHMDNIIAVLSGVRLKF